MASFLVESMISWFMGLKQKFHRISFVYQVSFLPIYGVIYARNMKINSIARG
jgi:hypothetical protein